MKPTSIRASLLAITSFLFAIQNVNGDIIILKFSGEIDAFSNVLTEGTPFAGEMRYDSDLLRSPAFFNVPDFRFTLGTNLYEQVGPELFFNVANDLSINGWDLFNTVGGSGVFDGPTVSGNTLLSGSFDIRDFAGEMLTTGDRLPSSLDFALADSARFDTSWETASGGAGTASGNITSFSLTSVPEPNSLTLLAIGTAALATYRRRRSPA